MCDKSDKKKTGGHGLILKETHQEVTTMPEQGGTDTNLKGCQVFASFVLEALVELAYLLASLRIQRGNLLSVFKSLVRRSHVCLGLKISINHAQHMGHRENCAKQGWFRKTQVCQINY